MHPDEKLLRESYAAAAALFEEHERLTKRRAQAEEDRKKLAGQADPDDPKAINQMRSYGDLICIIDHRLPQTQARLDAELAALADKVRNFRDRVVWARYRERNSKDLAALVKALAPFFDTPEEAKEAAEKIHAKTAAAKRNNRLPIVIDVMNAEDAFESARSILADWDKYSA